MPPEPRVEAPPPSAPEPPKITEMVAEGERENTPATVAEVDAPMREGIPVKEEAKSWARDWGGMQPRPWPQRSGEGETPEQKSEAKENAE